MECLMPPTLTAIRELRWGIESHLSVRDCVRAYVAKSNSPIADLLRNFLIHQQTGKASTYCQVLEQKHPMFQKALIALVDRGCKGQPILEELTNLESEVLRAALLELDTHVSKLPFLAMIPLFFFQFPAFLLLLVGPLFGDLINQVNLS